MPPPRLVARIAAAVWLVLGLLAPAGAAGQEGCAFGEGSGTARRTVVPGGGEISYVSTPHFVCQDGVELWADSAVSYSQLGMSLLMGSVRYLGATRELRADTARYFTDAGRLQANGHVFIRDQADGSEIENGDLVYLRQTDFRDVEEMTVTTGADGIRPRALVPPARADSSRTGAAAPPPAPYEVIGDRIFLRGDSYFTAAGDVEVVRDSLRAYADSAEYDQVSDALLLEDSARVVSRSNELRGRTITVGSPGADSSRVHAVKDALLLGEGLRLTAPQIVVFLSSGDLQRLVATPIRVADPGAADSADVARPVAVLDDAELTADSLDIVAPDAQVERVVAVGAARTESTARDSLNTEGIPDVARTDWLEGDTVTVTFRPVAALAGPDSVAVAPPVPEPEAAPDPSAAEPEPAEERTRYEIERVVASGSASALYRLAPSDTTARVGVDPPALHYVVGDRITIRWLDGEVDDMQVVGQTRGVHLEPLAPATPPPADTAAVADTARAATIRGDTAQVGAAVKGGPAPALGGDSARESAPVPADTRPWGDARSSRKEVPWRRE